MTELPKKLTISVVICAHNEQDWITKTLASLLEQKRLPDEIIVVDNLSTDKTVEVIERFIAKHPQHNIRIISETKKGLHHAREAGWRAAQSEIVVSTDADITFSAEWLVTIERAFENPDVYAVTGVFRYTDALPIANWVTQMSDEQRAKAENTHLNGGNSAIRRHVLEEVDGYLGKPLNDFEDQYLSSKIHAAGYKIRFMPELLAFHTFRRFNKEGLWGYIKYIFFYTAENIYPDHLSDESPYSVAVVIPAHNAEKSIRSCLESLLQQQPLPQEIIVVDCSSTDRTIELVNTFSVQAPAIRLIREAETTRSRELGARASKSDIVVMVSPNQVFPEGWLAKIHAAFIVSPNIAALGGELRVDSALPLLPLYLSQAVQNLWIRWRSRNSKFVYLPAAMSAFKREVLEKLDYTVTDEISKGAYELRFKPDVYAIRRNF